MSVALEPAGSQDVAMPTTERIDRHDNYVYNIPYSDLSCICHFLDKNDVWKQLAIHMGYTVNDCIVSFLFIIIILVPRISMFEFITFFTAIQAIGQH